MNTYSQKFFEVMSFIFLVSELHSSSTNDFPPRMTTQRTTLTTLSQARLNVTDVSSMLDHGVHARQRHVGLKNKELQDRLHKDKTLHSASTFRTNLDQDNATAQVMNDSGAKTKRTLIHGLSGVETKTEMTSVVTPVKMGLAKKNSPVQSIMAKKTTVVIKQGPATEIGQNIQLSRSNGSGLGMFQTSKIVIPQSRIVTAFPRK